MTQDRFELRRLFRNTFIIGCFLALLAGCSSGAGTKTTTIGMVPEPEENRPVAMMGEEKYFDGQITALVTISQGLDGLARRGGWRSLGRTRAEEPNLAEVFKRELGDTEKNDLGQTISKMQALQVVGSPLPPVSIRVQLTNSGSEPVTVGIQELNSLLGNFAVRPAQLILPPGERVSPEGMSSRLGVTSTEIPVKLVLALGDRTETRTVLVRNVVIEPSK